MAGSDSNPWASEPLSDPRMSMRNHWRRHDWHAGRLYYHWYLTFEGDRELHSVVRAYQRWLEVAGLDLVPPPWLHLTVQRLGFVDEVSTRDVERIVARARRRCVRLHPFELSFGHAVVHPEAIFMPASPNETVHELRNALRDAIAEVWGPDRVPGPGGFLPHVSLAYSSHDGPASSLVELVGSPAGELATVAVGAVHLLKTECDTHVWRWTVEATVPLGSG